MEAGGNKSMLDASLECLRCGEVEECLDALKIVPAEISRPCNFFLGKLTELRDAEEEDVKKKTLVNMVQELDETIREAEKTLGGALEIVLLFRSYLTESSKLMDQLSAHGKVLMSPVPARGLFVIFKGVERLAMKHSRVANAYSKFDGKLKGDKEWGELWQDMDTRIQQLQGLEPGTDRTEKISRALGVAVSLEQRMKAVDATEDRGDHMFVFTGLQVSLWAMCRAMFHCLLAVQFARMRVTEDKKGLTASPGFNASEVD